MPPLNKQPQQLENVPKEKPQPILTVNEIMDEELLKAKENETKSIESFNKDFEEFTKMETCNVTNAQIYEAIQRLEKDVHENNKGILANKKQIIDASKEDYNLSIHAITELHYLKKHFTKISVLVVLLVFVCGTGFGTIYESWLPYVDTLIDFFRITNQVSKGV